MQGGDEQRETIENIIGECRFPYSRVRSPSEKADDCRPYQSNGRKTHAHSRDYTSINGSQELKSDGVVDSDGDGGAAVVGSDFFGKRSGTVGQ